MLSRMSARLHSSLSRATTRTPELDSYSVHNDYDDAMASILDSLYKGYATTVEFCVLKMAKDRLKIG